MHSNSPENCCSFIRQHFTILTSSSICDSCAGLSQKVAKLEQQISTLLKIQEDRDLDVIVGKTRAAATSDQLADTAHYSFVSESRPYSSRPSKDSHEHRWSQQGARPKGPISSTPVSDPWIAVGTHNGCRTRGSWLLCSSPT